MSVIMPVLQHVPWFHQKHSFPHNSVELQIEHKILLVIFAEIPANQGQEIAEPFTDVISVNLGNECLMLMLAVKLTQSIPRHMRIPLNQYNGEQQFLGTRSDFNTHRTFVLMIGWILGGVELA